MQGSVVLGESDFMRHLREQLQFLRVSAMAFDCGMTAEARRIAVVVYTLLVDTPPKITSLVTHLGWTNLKMIDSGSMVRRFEKLVKADIAKGGGNPANLVMQSSPLTYYTNNPPGQSISMTQDFEKADRIPMAEWFDQTAIYYQSSPISRWALVRFFRHQDGGAHIDGKVKQDIYGVAREGAADFRVQVNGKDLQVTNTAELAMRQIGLEVDVSITEYLQSAARGHADS